MQFTQPWRAVSPGDRYARDFYVGDEVPTGLEAAAVKAGVAPRPSRTRRKADRTPVRPGTGKR